MQTDSFIFIISFNGTVLWLIVQKGLDNTKMGVKYTYFLSLKSQRSKENMAEIYSFICITVGDMCKAVSNRFSVQIGEDMF